MSVGGGIGIGLLSSSSGRGVTFGSSLGFTFGGGIGTDLTFKYVAEDVVFVTGDIMVNLADTAIDALQATSFTGTGY